MLFGGLPQLVSSPTQSPFCCWTAKLIWYRVPAAKLNITRTSAVDPGCETGVAAPTGMGAALGEAEALGDGEPAAEGEAEGVRVADGEGDGEGVGPGGN